MISFNTLTQGDMMSGISRDTFKGYSNDSKLDTLFDGVNDIKKALEEHPKGCEDRFVRLEKKKVLSSVITSIVVVIAAIGAVLAKLKPWSP